MKMNTLSGVSDAPAALKNLRTSECHYLREDTNIIGRNSKAFICIQEKQVSRVHCVINKHEEGNFSICNLSSVQGTLINGEKLMKNDVRVLCDRDKIFIPGIAHFYTFEFIVNKKYGLVDKTSEEVSSRLEEQTIDLEKSSEEVSSRFQEQIIDLDTSYTEDMKKLSDRFTDYEVEKGGLKEELNSRLEAQEMLFQEERRNLVTSSNESKQEAERKLKEVEDRSNREKAKLKEEIEEKINHITEKEKELEDTKISMEYRYQTERGELEERCKVEIEALKERLAESEMEQGRLKDETLEVEQKLKETRQNLHQSELEQFRLHQEKVEVEKKLESKIDDLTQESSTKDEIVKFLEQRLFEKEEAEEKIKKEMEDLEEELQCSICSELFIEPCVLNCGHLFCKGCIDEWKKKTKKCPMCRAKIASCVRMPKMDAIIDKNVSLLSNEAKERRKCTITDRTNTFSGSNIPAKKRKFCNYHRNQPPLHFPVPLYGATPMGFNVPSTSHGTNVANNMMQIPLDDPVPLDLSEPDPFAWTNRGPIRQRDHIAPLRTDSPVTVAAVDLTDTPPGFGRPPYFGTRAHTRTSTVSAADTTIDLTSF